MIDEWRKEEYVISTDQARLDLDLIHGFLTTSYWAAGVPKELVRKSIKNSLAFGLFTDNGQLGANRQIGFARVITDYATFAYLADVFVLEEYRGRGLAKWLVEVIASHSALQGFRRWMLATRDAHDLYRKIGFTEVARPERWMEKHDPQVYVNQT